MTSTILSNLLTLILFADDTNVFMSHKDLNYLSDMFNKLGDGQTVNLVQSKQERAYSRIISLACLKIRSRNEEAINSTQNRIYSLKVFHSLLLDFYFLFVSELI